MKWQTICSIAVLAGGAVAGLRPVVVWHGMADSYNSPAMLLMMQAIKLAHPGIQVYPVRLANNGIEDQEKTYAGVIDEQVSSCWEMACQMFWSNYKTR